MVGHGLHKFRWIEFSGGPADETVAQITVLRDCGPSHCFAFVFWERTMLHP